ncbi:MAG: hypothetical protein REI12_07230 [Pedobacter sp.]|nr:hypothetical protein [Pedobacter sp.]
MKHQGRSLVCTIGLLFALMLALPVSAATRPLDLDACSASFDDYQQAALANSRLRLATEQARISPRPKAIDDLERDIAAAEGMPAEDFFASRFGSGSAPAQERMRDFVQGLSLANARERRKEDMAMLKALKAGAYEAYSAIKGSSPESPIEAAYLQAMSDADLCVWNARITQITGKALPAAAKLDASTQNASMPPKECVALQKKISGIVVPPDASITASQETVMFMARAVIDMIDGGCPGGTAEQRSAERKLRQQQYDAAERACNAVQAGGRHCVAQNYFEPGLAPPVKQTPPAAPVVAQPAPARKTYRCQLDPVTGNDPPDMVAYDPVTGIVECEPGADERRGKKPKASGSRPASSGDWETSPGIRH